MASYFCAALVRAGHRVVVICGEVPQVAKEAGNRMLEEMRQAGITIQPMAELQRLIRPSTVRQVRDIILAERGDCVISFQQRDQTTALWAARCAGVPGVVSAQNQCTFWGAWPLRKLKEQVFGFTARRFASLAVCTSEVVQRELIDRFRFRADRSTVLPNGVPVHGFPTFRDEDKREARRSLGVHDDELLLINVGRIDTQKGQDILVEAVARVNYDQKFKLVCVGGVSRGGNHQRMQQFSDGIHARVKQCNLEDRVVFAGWRNNVPLLLSAADAYVHSARWEGWPLVLVEAMAAELPVVGTDCAGRPTGFADGTHGYIVNTEDVDALKTGIEKVVRMNGQQRTEMGQAGRKLAERHYDIGAISEEFVRLVESVL
jgi:glycosyltransferase involved in cell wall biosynthesis